MSGGQEGSETVATRDAVGDKQRSSETASVSPTTPTSPQRTRESALKWAAVVVVMIILGTGGYFVCQHLEAERQRVQAIADAKAERVARLAREAEEAKRKAEALRRADERAWQQAKRLDTFEAYNAYLKSFPNGIHKDAALAKVAALEAEAKRKVEAFRKHAADASDCAQSQDLERRITACTRLLGTERLSRAERASAYIKRGVAYGRAYLFQPICRAGEANWNAEERR